MAVLDMLKRRQDFTDTENALAEYVLDNVDEVADMSIAQLSAATHTSNAAVVRFCKKIGIDGYRAFRIQLARELERVRTHALDINPDQPFIEGASTRDIMSAVATLSKQAVDQTYGTVSTSSVRTAAQLVRGARHVVVHATGDTRICGIGFSNLLLKLGIICTMGDQYGDYLVVSNTLGPQDVALIITYSGTLLRDIGSSLDVLRARGCKVILITANEQLEGQLAGTDCVILLPRSETRAGRIATYYSQASIRYVLNCIYGEVFARTWHESMEKRDRYASLA
ncbi:MAG: MurR/RpiR family transcriptional regulator [Acidobacteriota bacterium]|nr:MurR/RpiR family transcriptional regulator [Acidobacteriota bacterium]